MEFSYKTKLFFTASVNEEEPLKGIFDKLLSISDIIINQNIIVKESSFYVHETNPRVHAEELIYRRQAMGWASENRPNSYFEILFPFHVIELTNYTFLATAQDDEIPRNWSVYCMDRNQKQVLAEEINNNELCDGKTGLEVYCGEYDTKIFPIKRKQLCQRIRFEQTGKNSALRDYFVLSGVELFGNLFYSFRFLTFERYFRLPVIVPLIINIIF